MLWGPRLKLIQESGHCLRHLHSRAPAETLLQLGIGVTVSLPLRCAASPIEHRWKLVLGRLGIFFPQQAKTVCQWIWHRNRKTSGFTLIRFEKFSTRRRIVVHHVESFAIDTWDKTGQDDCLCTIVDKSQRQPV